MSAIVGRHNVARSTETAWRYEWGEHKPGSKSLLLTDGGIAVIGHVGADRRGYIAWAPLPDRDREKEAALAQERKGEVSHGP